MNIHNDVPTIKCHINEHEKAHHEVLNNPYWFSDKPQLLSETFSAEKTKTRSRKVLDILRRAENPKLGCPTNSLRLLINWPSATAVAVDLLLVLIVYGLFSRRKRQPTRQ